MQRLSHHLRGLMVALAALALTAGAAFAARPSAETGLERAAEAAGKTVPPVAIEEPTVPDVDDEHADEPDGEEVVDDEEAVDEEDAADGDRPMNHGWYVSEAAKGPTPDGYRNHGEYVSEVARGDDGKPGADDEEADEAEADGESTEASTAKPRGKDRAEQAKAGNAERRADRGGK